MRCQRTILLEKLTFDNTLFRMKRTFSTTFFGLLFFVSLVVGNSALGQIQSKNSSENYLFSNDRVWVSQVYPNPALDFVDIDFQIASSVREVKLTFYNVLGQEVKDVVLEKDQKSTHISLRELNSGMYMYQLTIDGRSVATKKLIVRKQ
jgi:hypothetical protein